MKLVIWDYDGVLVDSFRNVHQVYQAIGKELGVDVPGNFEDFKSVYGYNSKECYRNMGVTEDMHEKWNERYSELILEQDPEPIEGAAALVHELKGRVPMVLLSASPMTEVTSKLSRDGLMGAFDELFAGEDGKGPLRKSVAIPMILKRYCVDGTDTLFIADRDSDYDLAIRSGVPAENIILTSYGWGFDEEATPGRTHRTITDINDLRAEILVRL